MGSWGDRHLYLLSHLTAELGTEMQSEVGTAQVSRDPMWQQCSEVVLLGVMVQVLCGVAQYSLFGSENHLTPSRPSNRAECIP